MEKNIIERQFGLWESSISPGALAEGQRISDVMWDETGFLVWLESRSDRMVLVVQGCDGQAMRDLNSTFSVRAKIGYGGGDFCVGNGQVYFVDAESGRLFRQALAGGSAEAISPGFGASGAPVLSPDGNSLLFIRSYEGKDSLEIVDVAGNHWPKKLVSGNDFYMQPAWHPDGSKIAWISWDHPNMPWDGTRLWTAKIDFSKKECPMLEEKVLVAGGDQISIFQAQFSPDGRYLAYVSDKSGWWQIYVYDQISGVHKQLTHTTAEHGIPGWVQGMRTYAFSPDGSRIYFIRNQDGQDSLWELNLDSGEETQIHLPGYTNLVQIHVSSFGIALIGSGGAVPTQVISTPLKKKAKNADTRPSFTIWRRTTAEDIPVAYYSLPRSIDWIGLDGECVHGIYYPPQNPGFTGVGKPPLIVSVHGGPTSQVGSGFNTKAQFFTSRGYAFLEVNYRGSTGYGRAYREKLRGNWGIFDVEDTISGATHLIKQDLADQDRIIIMGGSAGGFTVYKAMEDHPEFFKAGISLFGVSNQFALAAETHKFEAHYTDSLIGILPTAADLYRERSPIYFANKIKRPMAIFQGENDVVVPRNQSDEIVDILRRNGVPVVYHIYPGEGHGFRKKETISHMYQEILKFLRDYVIYS